MGIDLYNMDPSPPCTAVRLLAKAVDIDLNLKNVDMMKGENRTPEYLKMNPQHTIPTMDDNGFYLAESRAIMLYLCEISPKGYTVLPKCPRKRALVNQRLYFDMGTLYPRFGDIVYPVAFGGVKEVTDMKRQKLDEALKLLDGFLSDGFVAGDTMTVADFAVVASMAAMEAVGIKFSQYNNISDWFAKCKSTMTGYHYIDHSKKYGMWIGGKIREAGVTL